VPLGIIGLPFRAPMLNPGIKCYRDVRVESGEPLKLGPLMPKAKGTSYQPLRRLYV